MQDFDANEEPDELDRLEEAFAECPRASKVVAYIIRDPGAPEPQRLPPLALRRDAEAYPQIVEHVVAQAEAAPGVYLVRLREGGKYRTNTKLNLLFSGHTERHREAAPQATPLSGPVTPQAMPMELARVEPDYAREVGDRLVRRALEELMAPPEPEPYEDDEEVDDEEEDDEEETSQLSGWGGAVVELGKTFMGSEGGKELLGDLFGSIAEEKRARARKMSAEADEIRSRVPSSTKPKADGTTPLSGGLGEVLRFRVVNPPAPQPEEEEAQQAAEGG